MQRDKINGLLSVMTGHIMEGNSQALIAQTGLPGDRQASPHQGGLLSGVFECHKKPFIY